MCDLAACELHNSLIRIWLIPATSNATQEYIRCYSGVTTASPTRNLCLVMPHITYLAHHSLIEPRPVAAVCHVTGRPIMVKRKPDFTEEDVATLQVRGLIYLNCLGPIWSFCIRKTGYLTGAHDGIRMRCMTNPLSQLGRHSSTMP
eukprot:SAG11_NODE_177_length_13334_cov_9.614280_8_plen_146_part_00